MIFSHIWTSQTYNNHWSAWWFPLFKIFPFIWIYLGDVPFYSEESLWISSFLVGNIPTLITRCVQVLTKLEASSAESWISGMGQVTCGRKKLPEQSPVRFWWVRLVQQCQTSYLFGIVFRFLCYAVATVVHRKSPPLLWHRAMGTGRFEFKFTKFTVIMYEYQFWIIPCV